MSLTVVFPGEHLRTPVAGKRLDSSIAVALRDALRRELFAAIDAFKQLVTSKVLVNVYAGVVPPVREYLETIRPETPICFPAKEVAELQPSIDRVFIRR